MRLLCGSVGHAPRLPLAAIVTMIHQMANEKTTTEAVRTRTLRHLRELIAALDRRVPHIEDTGEIVIARDAAALRQKAMQRITELESGN